MTLYIIRHGETDLNRKGIVQGSGVDSTLNSIGHNQARLFFEYYKNIHFDYIITSNLQRTHQTVAPFLKRGTHHKWIKMPELNEISWGVHEGQASSPQTHDSYLKLMNDWESGVYSTKLEAGESAAELHERVNQAVHFFKKPHHKGKNLLICTHGRTLLCLLTILKEHPLSMMNQFKHQNTCLYKVHHIGNEFIFELENDVRHLNR
ncbi:MAG: histidine phosphatase family protein [Saprospiraceae bacterium]|nr:histidine phosphatase family protein [Saprospiraceae bacterium]